MGDLEKLLTTGPVEVFGTSMLIEAGVRLKFRQLTPPKGWKFIENAVDGIICEKE